MNTSAGRQTAGFSQRVEMKIFKKLLSADTEIQIVQTKTSGLKTHNLRCEKK